MECSSALPQQRNAIFLKSEEMTYYLTCVCKMHFGHYAMWIHCHAPERLTVFQYQSFAMPVARLPSAFSVWCEIWLQRMRTLVNIALLKARARSFEAGRPGDMGNGLEELSGDFRVNFFLALESHSHISISLSSSSLGYHSFRRPPELP